MASLQLPPKIPPRSDASVSSAPPPGQHRGTGAFLPEPLTPEQVADLLSAGFDVTCRPNWGRSAPSAHGWEQVCVYAVLPEATYRYDARQHRLVLVKPGDWRAASGLEDCVATAPVHLVYVVDIDALEQAHAEEHGVLAGADAGCIVENVHRYCDGASLAAVVRGPVDRRRLAQVLGLKPTQHIALAQAVGHPQAPGH